MFKYYNEEERMIYESIPIQIMGRPKGALMPNTPSVNDEKEEFRTYFKNRQFILETITPREARILDLYYGINGGKSMTLEQVAQIEGVSRERIRQIIAKALRKLRHPSRKKLYINLTDSEVGYTDADKTWLKDDSKFVADTEIDENEADDEIVMKTSEDDKLNFYNLEKLSEKKLDQIKLKKIESFSEEEKIADFVWRRILVKPIGEEFGLTNVQMIILKGCLNEWQTISYQNIVTIPIKQLQEKNLQIVVDKVHDLGLHFTCEAEYQEEWENLCRLGVMRVGVEELKTKFSIQDAKISASADRFVELMQTLIEELDMSIRSFNCLKRAGIDTVEDLVKMSEDDLIRVRNLGRRSFEEVIYKVRDLGLDIRPEDASPENWIRDLLTRFTVDVSDKNMLNSAIDGLHQGDETELEKVSPSRSKKEKKLMTDEEKFKKLMEMEIVDLDLSVRSFNLLNRARKETVEDLVKMSEENLIKVRNLGKKVYEEIIAKVRGLGLDIRPEDFSEEEWIEKLKERFVKIEVEPDDERFDINEIPEKYRKTYAIGAGVVATQEIEQKSKGLISRSATRKAGKTSEKPSLPKSKISKEQINEISDEKLLEVVAEDISVINELDNSFIVRYRKELIKIVLENASLDTDKRFNLIERINNATVYNV